MRREILMLGFKGLSYDLEEKFYKTETLFQGFL